MCAPAPRKRKQVKTSFLAVCFAMAHGITPGQLHRRGSQGRAIVAKAIINYFKQPQPQRRAA